jgi:putative peptidoglycan lipid II flippase
MSNLKSRFGLLVLLSAAGYAVSFFSQLVIAYHFGTSQALDAYWGGLALVGLLSFYMSPLKEALVPALHRAQERGNAQAGRVLSAGLSLLLALTAVSGAVLWVAAGGVAGLLMGTDGGASGAVVALVPWLLPYLCLFVLAETLNATLVSFNQVLRQAVVRIAAALVLLATIAAVGASLGVGGLLLAQILSMTTLVVISGLALRHLRLGLLVRAWPVLRESGMVPLFASLLLTYFFAQIYVLAERSAMIHFGTGLVSSFQYSTVLVNALVSLLAYPLSNLLWSQFLARAAAGDGAAGQALAVRACGLLFYLLMVACAFTWTHARDIIVLLYGRGAFDEASVQLTTAALRATIFASIPISLMAILGRWLMSLPGAYRQVWIGLATTVVGLLVIGGAVLAGSSRWLLQHWLLANLAGLLVSGALFVSAAGFSLAQAFAAARWLALVALVAVVAAWMTPSILWGESKTAVAAALLAQGGLYLLTVAGLTWAFRMAPSLRAMVRGRHE